MNAKQAREKAIEVRLNDPESLISKIMADIKQKSENGEFQLVFNTDKVLTNSEYAHMCDLGYTVVYNLYELAYTIKW